MPVVQGFSADEVLDVDANVDSSFQVSQHSILKTDVNSRNPLFLVGTPQDEQKRPDHQD